MLDTKRNRKRMLFRAGVALFLLCIVLSIASALELPTMNNSTVSLTAGNLIISPAANISTATQAVVAGGSIVVLVIVFGGLVILGYLAKERGRLDQGEMRRAIAGTFVVGFTILVILCIMYGIYREGVILAYIELVGIVVGFYFGAKTAEQKRAEAAVNISIEHVRFLDLNKIAITIRNGGESEKSHGLH